MLIYRVARTRVAKPALVALALAMAPTLSMADSKTGPSDQAVHAMMGLAFDQLPNQFSFPSGKTIVLNKKKPNEIVVPIEVGREIVTAAYRSYEAKICNLAEELSANRDSMMARQKATGKWNEQQMQYIHMLHVTVVLYTAGQLKITLLPDGDRAVADTDPKPEERIVKAETCNEQRKQRVQESIAAYVRSGPALPIAAKMRPAPAPPVAAATPPPASGATDVPKASAAAKAD